MGFTSCDTNTPYYHYAHTPIDGWEKNDTLRYDVQPLKKGGEHKITPKTAKQNRHNLL